ncbi:MAG: copper resistance protein CopC [Gemmatimonadota bacterium]|nr:copper resistance protein CopC [Gemmatimonadota bacterium]
MRCQPKTRSRPIRLTVLLLPALLAVFPASVLGHIGRTDRGSVERPSGRDAATVRTGPVSLHTRLESSVPARDDTLHGPLAHARLVFSGPVTPGLSAIVLRRPAGDSVALAVQAVEDSAAILRADLPPLTAGPHEIAWRTVSADGHPVSGVIPFHVAESGAARPRAALGPGDEGGPADADDGARPASSAAPSGVADRAAEPGVQEPEAHAPPLRRTLLRGLGLAALLAAAGLLWFVGGTVLVREPRVLRAAGGASLAAAVLLALALLDWLSAAGPPGASLLNGLGAALDTRTGVVEGTQVVLAALLLLLAGGAHAGRLAAVLALLATVLGAATGHPATVDPGILLPANALHLGAVAIWVGGVLLLAVLPAGPAAGGDGWSFGEVAGRVSSRAFLAVGVVLGTAVLQQLVLAGGPAALLEGTYGRLLLGKWAGLLLLLGFGAWHRWKTFPRLAATGDPTDLRRAVRVELFVMAAVVLLAAWLGQVSPPAAG